MINFICCYQRLLTLSEYLAYFTIIIKLSNQLLTLSFNSLNYKNKNWMPGTSCLNLNLKWNSNLLVRADWVQCPGAEPSQWPRLFLLFLPFLLSPAFHRDGSKNHQISMLFSSRSLTFQVVIGQCDSWRLYPRLQKLN